MAKWHNKHVSTQWGIAVLGFLLIATALLIPYLNQQQNLEGNAYYQRPRPTVAPTKKPLPTVVPTKKPFPTKKPLPTQVPRGYWW